MPQWFCGRIAPEAGGISSAAHTQNCIVVSDVS